MADLELAEMTNAEIVNEDVLVDIRGFVFNLNGEETDKVTIRTFKVISTFQSGGISYLSCSARMIQDSPNISIPVATEDYDVVNTLLAAV